MTVFEKTNWLRENQLLRMHRNSLIRTKILMEIKKKKHVLLEDEASDWHQIWMAASLLDVKGNKEIKKLIFLLTGQFPRYGHIFTCIYFGAVYVD